MSHRKIGNAEFSKHTCTQTCDGWQDWLATVSIEPFQCSHARALLLVNTVLKLTWVNLRWVAKQWRIIATNGKHTQLVTKWSHKSVKPQQQQQQKGFERTSTRSNCDSFGRDLSLLQNIKITKRLISFVHLLFHITPCSNNGNGNAFIYNSANFTNFTSSSSEWNQLFFWWLTINGTTPI